MTDSPLSLLISGSFLITKCWKGCVAVYEGGKRLLDDINDGRHETGDVFMYLIGMKFPMLIILTYKQETNLQHFCTD